MLKYQSILSPLGLALQACTIIKKSNATREKTPYHYDFFLLLLVSILYVGCTPQKGHLEAFPKKVTAKTANYLCFNISISEQDKEGYKVISQSIAKLKLKHDNSTRCAYFAPLRETEEPHIVIDSVLNGYNIFAHSNCNVKFSEPNDVGFLAWDIYLTEDKDFKDIKYKGGCISSSKGIPVYHVLDYTFSFQIFEDGSIEVSPHKKESKFNEVKIKENTAFLTGLAEQPIAPSDYKVDWQYYFE